jgi:hypothetical protein
MAIVVPTPLFLAKIPVPITVPVVVMLYPTTFSFPVTFKVFPALITRTPPASANIRCPSPIAVMPLPTVSNRIPITFDPYKFGSRCGWKNANYRRRWRRANPDPD